MLNLKLNIQPRTEQKLKKILIYAQDEETFAQHIIAFQIGELQKAILNLRLDLKEYETRHGMQTEVFYRQFQKGLTEDNEELMIWAGLYEMLKRNEEQLQDLQND